MTKTARRITEAEANYIVELWTVVRELPKTRRRLNAKAAKGETIYIEIAAADMFDGEGQGSESYFYLPPQLGHLVLDFVKGLVAKELERLGAAVPK